MYLKRLEIQGFKSFANKTVLEFPKINQNDKGITAVVGPNGSGKSNISDAIRWVLGEQSVKSLRGKKTEDLIFSGSSKQARMSRASVSLHLDNSDHVAPIEYDELAITRSFYRNGEGDYSLNQKPVRLLDIAILLAKAKFAQKTYSVISQGTIDAVLTALPTERKEFFDEAAGVKEFQIKRDQSLNKLKNTQTNLQQVDIIVQEIEPRLNSLTRQVKKLEKREELEKNLRERQINYYSDLLNQINKQLKQTQAELEIIKPQIATTQKTLTDKQAKLNQAFKEVGRVELFHRLQLELNKLVQEKNNLLREQTLLKGRQDIDYAKSGKLNLVWLEKKQNELQIKITELEQLLTKQPKLNTLAQELSDKNDELEKIELELDQFKSRIQELGAEKAEFNSINAQNALEEIISRQQELLNNLQKATQPEQFAALKELAEQISQKLINFKDKYLLNKNSQEVVLELEQLQKSISSLESKKSDLLKEIHNENIDHQVLVEKNNLLTNELEQTKRELIKIGSEMGWQQSTNIDQNQELIIQQNNLLEEQLKNTVTKIDVLQQQVDQFNEQEEKKKAELFLWQQEVAAKQKELSNFIEQENKINIDLAKLNTQKDNLLTELDKEGVKLEWLNNNYALNTNREEAVNQIRQLKHQLELLGGIDSEVVAEYQQIKERYDFLTSQTADLKHASSALEQVITELDKTIVKEFNQSFGKINKEFDRYFKILFGGGDAKLEKITAEQLASEKSEKEAALIAAAEANAPVEVEKTEEDIIKKFKRNDLYVGVDIKATPPGKKISQISLLSGGERALTAIALICAIISCQPSPFVVLDEVDAALDEANSERFAAILHQLSQKTQFIVITHNRSTMQQAKILYGVTMGEDGISRLLSIKLAQAEELEKSGQLKFV